MVIEPDGEQTVHPSVAPPEVTDFASLVEAGTSVLKDKTDLI